MDISIVIPFLDEAESLPELTEWIQRVVTENNFSYEMIMVDDGSSDHSWQVVKELSKKNPNIKAIKLKLHDFNCGLKAYKLKVVKSIEVYGEMHRYIPLLAKWAGFKKIGEKVVEHRPRKYGKSKFGMGRIIKGGLDLTSIVFVGKYSKRPMHFFGTWGIVFFLAVFGISIYIVISKFIVMNFEMTSVIGFD